MANGGFPLTPPRASEWTVAKDSLAIMHQWLTHAELSALKACMYM